MVHFVYFTLANLLLHNILLLVLLFGFVCFVCNVPTNSSPLAPIKAGPNRLDARRRSVAITGVRAHDLTANALPACGRDLVGSRPYLPHGYSEIPDDARNIRPYLPPFCGAES